MNNIHLRCALTGFEINYQLKIPSKQLTKNFSTISRVIESIIPLSPALTAAEQDGRQRLNPWFLTGFTDAEGTFTVVIVKDKKYKLN
jgi:hypothetical protein